MAELAQKKCVPCEGGTKPLTIEAARQLLSELEGWQLNEEHNQISKHYSFKNFYKTMSFVNAVAFIANEQNHHPDMSIGYNYCNLVLTTHAISGLSENDFIVAAKINHLITQ